MSNLVSRLIHRLRHGTAEEHTVMILGLDNSGKTTLLYLLKLNEVVEATPSIGFNVESLDLSSITRNGRPLLLSGWDIGGGCDAHGRFISPLLPMYIVNSEAIVWMVDASDKKRVEQSVEALKQVIWMVDNDKDMKVKVGSMFPIMILANKCDKPETLSIDQVRIAFSKVVSGRLASIYSTSLTTKPPIGLSESFEWLSLALDLSKQSTQTPSSPSTKPSTAMPNPRSPTDLAQKLESWLNRTEKNTDGLSDEELLARFRSFDLPSWDHYTHIRLAYVVLMKHGRKEGKEILFDGLEKYISNGRDTGGKTFHLSMTYFWIQIVHFGIRNMPSWQGEPSAEKKHGVDSDPDTLNPFSEFLLLSPHVVDSNLWSEYYTKSTLMSPKAKSEMVLPDKKPLPSLASRDAIRTFGSATHDVKDD